MKPTKKIISEFPSIEENLVKNYETFKTRPTAMNLSALAISWGIFATHRELFELSMSMTENKMTEIFLIINDYSKDILIY